MSNKNKKATKALILKDLKNYKVSTNFFLNKKTLEQHIANAKKIRANNIEKYNKEIASIRQLIIDAMNLQDENKKIATNNLKIFEDNIKQEMKNLETSTENLKYLTSLLQEINSDGSEIEKVLFDEMERREDESEDKDDNEEGF